MKKPQLRTLLFFVLCLFSLPVFAQPSISSFAPASGIVGSPVTITGNNFSATPANNIVFFGAVKANVTAASPTSITATVPAGANYQPISVTVSNLTGYSAKSFIPTFPGGNSFVGFSSDFSQNIFQPLVDSATDLHPNGIALADLDGDGKPDVATPNNYSFTGFPASISILRNTTTGGAISFAQHQDIANGVQTYAIAAGDLDGDGKPDLVASSIVDSKISVFRNTSNPGVITFAPKIDYTSGSSPYGIAIADINGDGRPDIIVANFFSNSVSVFRNTTSGSSISFAAKADFTADLGPTAVAAGDVDGDGKPDIVVTNQLSDNMSVFRNTSSGSTISFAARADFGVGNDPRSAVIGDIDGDGKADLGVVSNQDYTFSILRNTGSAGNIAFAARVNFACGAWPNGLAIGDMNGDGKPDVAVTSQNLKAFQNTSTAGNIAFANEAWLAPSRVANVVVLGDITEDGKPDMIGSVFSGESVYFMRNMNNEPLVRGFSPTTAASGATVNIIGANFTGATGASFGGVPATSITVVNSASINAVVGTGVSGDVKVNNIYGSGSKSGFIFAGVPIISSFTPTSAAQGQTVTITGVNFTGTTAVSFGGTAAQSFNVTSPTTIEAVVGAGASGSVAVTTPFGTGTRTGFLILPGITSFTPAGTGKDSTVTITGTNLSGVTAVSFGGVPAQSFIIVSPTIITAVVGTGASGNVTLTNANGSNSLPGFTFIQSPDVVSFTPAIAGTGNTVTITGTNFNNATFVRFGNTAPTSFNVVSPTTITAVIGAGASGYVRVHTAGGSDSVSGFTYIPPPTITSFTPTTTGAGAIVTITGTDLSTTSAVSFGGTPAISFTVVSNTTVTAIVAATTSGPVSLTTIGGTTSRAGFVFTTLPIINSFAPASGPVGTVVTLTGANFGSTAAANTIWFGNIPATITSANANVITVTVPPGAGYHPISVTTNLLTAYTSQPFATTFAGGSPVTSTSFAGRTDFVAGVNPSSVENADLDGDGKTDLIVANYWNATISVLRNTGTPGVLSFADKVDFLAGNTPKNIAIGDIDGDGKLDVVVVNAHQSGSGDNTVSILRNTSVPGTISFSQRVILMPGFNPLDVAVADFNGDRKPDMAVTNHGNENISIFRNTTVNGVISFTPKQDINLMNGFNAHYVTDVVPADLDQDGRIDLVIGKSGSTYLTYMRNSSSGNSINFGVTFFGSLIGSGSFESIAVADFNLDGLPDIVTNDYIFRNTTNFLGLSFAIQGFSGGGGVAVVEDLSGDGKPDFAKVRSSTSVLTVRENTSPSGTVTFAPGVTFTPGTNPWGITSGDFNLDGKPDLATANYDLHSVSVLLGGMTSTSTSITSFTPTSGAAGTTVTITGTNFTGATAVSFGNTPATSFVVNSATSITAVVAAGSSGNVKVTAPAGNASLAWFTFIPPSPTITSFTPTSGTSGTVVTISGTNFISVTGISFAGSPVMGFTVNSPTSITATVGVGGTGNLVVTTSGGNATATGFEFHPLPVINSFGPASAAAGATVLIGGTGLSEVTSVTFGGVNAASFVVNNANQITAIVGTGATGSITVTSPVGSSSFPGFTFLVPLPVISSFSPVSAGAGTTVTITGTNFINASAVSFGGTPATSFTVVNSTTITAVVGAGSTGSVSITTPNGTGTRAGFTFIAPPTISQFAPTMGITGTVVTVHGTNFTGATVVSFGGTPASSIIAINSTTLNAIVAAGSSGNVSVTTPGGTASLGGFVYTFPTSTGSPGGNSKELVIYPNPVDDLLIVKHPSNPKGAEMKWVDIMGRVVKKVIVARSTIQTGVDVSALAPGIYRLIWSDGKTELAQTVMIY